MGQKVDLTGMRFGKWVVINKSESKRHWNCICDCGTAKQVNGQYLKEGKSRSCGCRRTKDGHSMLCKGPVSRTDKETFDFMVSRTISDEKTGCLIFQGAKTKSGYGCIGHQGKLYMTHRLILILSGVVIPDGMVVMHSCDTPSCINLNHLSVGTQLENRTDCTNKGRDNSSTKGGIGEKNPFSKLTNEIVLRIRERFELGESRTTIAESLMLSNSTIERIVNRTSWRHI